MMVFTLPKFGQNKARFLVYCHLGSLQWLPEETNPSRGRFLSLLLDTHHSVGEAPLVGHHSLPGDAHGVAWSRGETKVRHR